MILLCQRKMNNMNYKFYSIDDNRLLYTDGKETFEYKNNEWLKISNSEITDRLMGYDSSESFDSPYVMGSTDIMSSIKELTLEQVIEKYGKSVIDKIYKEQDMLNIYLESKKINKDCSPQEIIEIIKNNKGLEEIWISKNSKKYPCLVIQLNNELACVNYFPEDENETNWTSLGNYDKETIFLSGGEEWNAPGNSVIKIDQAIDCLQEFLNNEKEKPKCIEWQKLI